jgi:hypothetical protein
MRCNDKWYRQAQCSQTLFSIQALRRADHCSQRKAALSPATTEHCSSQASPVCSASHSQSPLSALHLPPALQLLLPLLLLLLLLLALASHFTYEYAILSLLLLVHWSPSSVSNTGTRVTASAAAASSGAASARGGAVQLTALLFRYTPGTSAAPKRHAILPVLAYSAVLSAGTDSVTGVPPRSAPLAGCSCPTA